MLSKFFKNEDNKTNWHLVLILLVAFCMRFIMLSVKPPHHDEGINGWFADRVVEFGCYRYDPTNYHGPLHFYIVFLFQSLFGRCNFILRFPTALLSFLTVVLVTMFSRFFGKRVAYIAALAMALSPGMVFYGKYAIHETDFVFFAILIFYGIVGLHREGLKKYLWCLAIGITGMILTKETYIIHFAGFYVAWISPTYLKNYFQIEEEKIAVQEWDKNYLKKVIIICLITIFLFYSGFFLYPKGIFGLIDTFRAWFHTGVSTAGHSKPFYYWLNLFIHYEYIVFIGLVFIILFFKNFSKWIKFISIYALFILLVYSFISYKTPWCIVSILWPFFFVFAQMASDYLGSKHRSESFIALVVIFFITTIQSFLLNFVNYADKKEPYVYVHTFKDLNTIINPLFKMVKISKANYSLSGLVLRSGEWPLPWVLGDFPKVAFYGTGAIPPKFDADFLVVEENRIPEVEANLQNTYYTEKFILRDFQNQSKLYFNSDKFKVVFENRIPDFKPNPAVPGQGLIGYYFSNKGWSGSPVFKKQATNINFYWEGENRVLMPPFSSYYEGEILIPATIRKLILATDDGGFLEIDGKRIINDPGPHGITEVVADVQGNNEWKKVKVGFYDEGGGAVLKMLWADINGNKEIVPSRFLKYSKGSL